ncbi:MAG: 16S rRNA (cytidine(1402)-2'-O)-methyltransferase [Acidimicrobiales bacterium]
MSGPEGAGVLVLVATPIGNLGDLSPRARDALAVADVVCCEDTRRTRALLSACGLPSRPARLVSLHGHNEAARVPEVLAWLANGRTIALVTDAGTPAISDPGARLVRAVTDAGFVVTEVPGPSAAVMALTLSGLDTERFCVEGFVPRKGAERRRRLEALGAEQRTAVLFEAPGRVAALLADLLAIVGDRPVALCRELTKVHEEVWRGSLARALDAVAERPPVGEVVVVLGGAAPPPGPDDDAVRAAVADRLARGDSTRQAAVAVAAALGVARRRAYNEALSLREGPPGDD